MWFFGDRLGLYKAMAGAGPLTPAELAERTGTAERYVREWLSNQAAGGYVTHDEETSRFGSGCGQRYPVSKRAQHQAENTSRVDETFPHVPTIYSNYRSRQRSGMCSRRTPGSHLTHCRPRVSSRCAPDLIRGGPFRPSSKEQNP